jgi:hypothetical protein
MKRKPCARSTTQPPNQRPTSPPGATGCARIIGAPDMAKSRDAAAVPYPTIGYVIAGTLVAAGLRG